MNPRIGVLFSDGSLLIVPNKNRAYAEQEAEAKDHVVMTNKGVQTPAAKLVSIDLEDGDIVEIDRCG